MNTKYKNTPVQRSCVEIYRAEHPGSETLTQAECWALVSPAEQQSVLDAISAAKQAAKDAQAAKAARMNAPVAPDEATAVVEHTAESFIIAMDEQSMVPLGLDKSDTEDLQAAADILSQWVNPDGTPLRLERTIEQLGRELWDRGISSNQAGAQWEAQGILERLVSGRKRQIHTPDGVLGSVPLVLGEFPDRVVGETAPTQIEWVITAEGTPARERREVVWAIAHSPIYELWTDGSGRVGTSSWIRGRDAKNVRPSKPGEPKPRIGSTYPGIQRSFRSVEEAHLAHGELRWALGVYRRIAALLIEHGDPRYSDDPVRTEGIQRDLEPRFKAGPVPASLA